ncbi:hypothetical protein H696_05925 [Fonticula alba]|uniref:Cytochrome P450, family 51 (Sterol 14-demethylase) n=1 Tax=Fonticula alba TaxID=691883 RepID=A0A058Z129_FONAL|nr:hypothetical protein H696_05925 [Fonticula alba]KCV67638.1 hypothetical protein H696_05925 [Fonticula alba]|eukprot:XP_009497976.1 hypothetical protein H696_05925 [Fonticula alba]
MVKGGLTTAAFRSYVSDIQEEVHQYFARWGNEGEADLYSAMCELVINTASRTLLGQDVRSQLNDEVARLYHDLDLGFTPINFLFPNLPLPRNIVRDRANLQLRELFVSVLRKRAARLEKLKAEGKEDSEVHHDMLNSLMNATYKDGRSLSEVEVAGLMIALLMAGQHTSSTSATWFGLYLLRDKEYLAKVMAEQESIFGDGKGGYVPLDFEGISNCDRLEYVLKEVLRLCPPIFQIMRTVTEDVYFNDMVIPAGSYVAVSPSVSSLDGKAFPNPNTFDPDRFSPERAEDSTEKNKGLYVPFGHGRHRCIGEPFAYLQIKTIWAAILQTFELEPVGPMNQPNFNSMIVLPETPCMVRYKRRVPL